MVLHYVYAFGIVEELAVSRGEQEPVVAFKDTHREEPREQHRHRVVVLGLRTAKVKHLFGECQPLTRLFLVCGLGSCSPF